MDLDTGASLTDDVVSSMNDGVVITQDGIIKYVNPEVTDLVGYEADELVGEPMLDFIDPEYRELVAERHKERTAGGNPPELYEIVVVSKDGNHIPVEINVNEIAYRGESATLSLVRDITERKKRERQLKRQNEQLNEFASMMSHDLRDLLNVAKGRLQILMDEGEGDSLKPVLTALTRMERLFEDVLDLAKAGESVGERVEVELKSMTEDCWENITTGNAELEPPREHIIIADPTRLQQLLENLLRNAVEHTNGSVTVSVGVFSRGFYVEDNGPGIPSEQRDEVFDPGYSTAPEGTGFGLSIVRDIAEAHGWEISITEGSSGGARFKITTNEEGRI